MLSSPTLIVSINHLFLHQAARPVKQKEIKNKQETQKKTETERTTDMRCKEININTSQLF